MFILSSLDSTIYYQLKELKVLRKTYFEHYRSQREVRLNFVLMANVHLHYAKKKKILHNIICN